MSDEKAVGYICSTPRANLGFWERVRARVLPFKPCEHPEAPSHFQDVIVTKCYTVLSFTDRLRILLTGNAEVETRIVTEHMVGEHRTKTVFRAGKFWGHPADLLK